MGATLKRIFAPFILILIASAPALSQETRPRAVPAEFVNYIKMPGTGDTVKRPNALHYDRFHDELLVGDSGHNRIVIFDPSGVFKFSFTLGDLATMPKDITTDPDGFIYVLGSSRQGTVLFKFDFDGVVIGSIDVPREWAGKPVELRSLACDEAGTLYALDHSSRRILVIKDDVIKRSISITVANTTEEPVISEKLKAGYALGKISYADGSLFVPISDIGTIHRYTKDGTFLGTIGHFGSEPGTLNFPIAAEATPDGIVLVLDRPRHAIVSYSLDGRFLGEFGGRGFSPGWFVGPSLLAVTSPDRVIVGQVYQNRIQVCALPDFIVDGLDQATNLQSTNAPGRARHAMADGSSPAISQRRSMADRRINAAADGEKAPSIFNIAQSVQNGTYLEVSE